MDASTDAFCGNAFGRVTIVLQRHVAICVWRKATNAVSAPLCLNEDDIIYLTVLLTASAKRCCESLAARSLVAIAAMFFRKVALMLIAAFVGEAWSHSNFGATHPQMPSSQGSTSHFHALKFRR
eukprot:2409816-Amphidinium_carterae.2